MTKIKFSDLHFKEKVWGLPELACALTGMTVGTTQAQITFENGYTISVLTDTYLCTKNTYEVGIVYNGLLCMIEDEKPLHERLLRLGLKDDGSGALVYGKVTKGKVEKAIQILEFYKGGKNEKISQSRFVKR